VNRNYIAGMCTLLP